MIYNGNYLGQLDPEPWLGHSTTPTTTPTAPTTNFWDKFTNAIDRVADITTSVVPVVNTIRNTQGGTVTPNQGISTTYGSQPPPVKVGLSTGAKVAIGVAGAGVVGTLIYLATRKKKRSLNGMSKKYFVTYDKKKGGTGIVMVKAENPITALKNARYLVATGSNFRNAEETNDNYTKPSKKGYQGRGRQN